MLDLLSLAGSSSNATWMAAGLSGVLFVGMLLAIEAGRWMGTRARARGSVGIGVVDGAIFSLFGLLIAFTFSGAASRFDHRRELIVEESNAIGTAWLRVSLLPGDEQPAMREAFRRYLDSRLEIYRRIPDEKAVAEAMKANADIQGEIWDSAVETCRSAGQSPCSMLLLPALNQMFDIATVRTMATHIHPPAIIVEMLALLAIASALLAGHGMAGQPRNFVHTFSFAIIVALTTYVILDIEYPRRGQIRIDTFDQALVDLRRSME